MICQTISILEIVVIRSFVAVRLRLVGLRSIPEWSRGSHPWFFRYVVRFGEVECSKSTFGDAKLFGDFGEA